MASLTTIMVWYVLITACLIHNSILLASAAGASSESCTHKQGDDDDGSAGENTISAGKYDAVSHDAMLIDVLGRELNERYLEIGKVSESDENLTRHFMSQAWYDNKWI